MAAEGSGPQTVTLVSEDKQQFVVPRTVAMRSTVVKQMLEDIPDSDEPVPLVDRSCKGSILQKVIEYLTKHTEFEQNSSTDEEKNSFDKEFVQVEDDVLFNLILAANYLDIKDLLDLTCKTVADYIKQCKTAEEIRQRFNIVNDFTPEEEEEVRRENAWCDEIS
mmetsp:Transcript_29350/g.68052  ORF Transcript_29350/g.68052 Transcript_29350/m.68052 type:complete len:164 (+) Transcript_29350:31-522(+)|eukprot:CAMPEP_0114553194 /NCGR_PEP_ID=MMETSP0114-20121206/7524_1 /TAXON_ID=31324 /ORGANISM="Goniomonas sp, Strain m" /LENGTH=163 /DNA_ID=CAMNT_0001738113 /DNA_START=27 /DNA_END=518 /DNA_ORIENTATION=+